MIKKLSFLIIIVLIPSVAFAVNPQADRIDTDTKDFNGILNSSDSTVQKALDKIDDYTPPVSDTVYLGDPNTDGTWRLVRDGNNLSHQKREGGAWVEKGADVP